MTEPDDFGLSAIATLAHVGDQSRSCHHTAFWKTWMEAVMASSPRLVPRESGDESDLSASHEFVSFGHVRIGCVLSMPKGRPRAALVVLHGYSNVPTLGQSAQDWQAMTDRGVAVLIVRVRGYPGSQRDAEQLVHHAGPHGGGLWATHGLLSPLSEKGCGTEWVFAHAVADVVNACRAIRSLVGTHTPLSLYGESLGAGLSLAAASQLAEIGPAARMAIGLPSMGDWPWRLSRQGPTLGVGGLIRGLVADNRGQKEEIAATLRVMDAAVHARRVFCPVLCKLAVRDEVVPAPAAAAVFNALGSAPGTKWRHVTRYGHFDGGIADARRHVAFDRLVQEFMDPEVDVMAHDWEGAMTRKPVRAESDSRDETGPTLFGGEPLVRDSDEALIAAYVSTGRTLDDLPYTPEFDRLFRAAGPMLPGKSEREVLHKLHNLRKAGKLPRLGKPTSSPPKIDTEAEATLAALVVKAVGSLGQRDQLPYTREFDDLAAAFNQRTGSNLAPHDVWRLVAKLAK